MILYITWGILVVCFTGFALCLAFILFGVVCFIG